MPVVAPLVVVLAPIVLALLVAAAWPFAQLLRSFAAALPLIGSLIGGAIYDAVIAITAALAAPFDYVMGPLADTIASYVIRWWNLMVNTSATALVTAGNVLATWSHADALYQAIEAQEQTDVRSLQSNINAVYGAMVADVLAGISQAESFATTAAHDIYGLEQTDVRSLQANINVLAGDVASGLATTLATAEGFATAAAHDIYGAEQTDVRALQSNINALAGTLGGDVSGLVGQIKTALDSAIATATADAAGALATAEAAANVAAAAASATAVGALDAAAHDLVVGPWAALLSPLGVIAGALDPAIAGGLGIAGVLAEPVPVSIPGILAMAVPAIATVATDVAECVTPNCSAIKGTSGLWHDLKAPGLWVALVGLLAWAATDPAAAAADAEGALTDVMGGALAAVRDLVGV